MHNDKVWRNSAGSYIIVSTELPDGLQVAGGWQYHTGLSLDWLHMEGGTVGV